MAANHTNHEALSESPLDSAVSESDLPEDIGEMLAKTMIMFKELVKPTEFQNSFLETDAFYDGSFSGELNAASSNMEQDVVSAFSEFTDSHLWSQDVTLMHSSPTMDSHSTITDVDWAVESPAVSANIIEGSHNQAYAASSGSLCEQSDVDDKAAATDKRQRRRILNKESARISRTRKRAQLLGLEWQAQNLKTENATLCKQLTDSWLQFYDANTNNQILKSNVEALRAKVKLAEDMISRINNQLVQNQSQLSTATQMISDVSSVGRMAHVSAANTGNENDASYGDMVLDQFGNQEIFSNFNM